MHLSCSGTSATKPRSDSYRVAVALPSPSCRLVIGVAVTEPIGQLRKWLTIAVIQKPVEAVMKDLKDNGIEN